MLAGHEDRGAQRVDEEAPSKSTRLGHDHAQVARVDDGDRRIRSHLSSRRAVCFAVCFASAFFCGGVKTRTGLLA